ncbi:Type 1 glutamine amidotransferase-like domain-containing protein [Enterococcus sp. DIV0800]|uniref:Type 1 glutamine amidotransferase-like domain-containing protein n=1 Tax=unclassified Enterococcus TaxID=2608891 RepID=UPI003D2FCEDB
MYKMLLVSMFHKVADLVKIVEPNLKDKSVIYISTASNVEKLGFFTKIGKWKLKKMGLIVDELYVSTAKYSDIVNKIENSDIIYIAGGNTFFLLQELIRSGADNVLIREIQSGKLYIGESAGVIVVAPDIEYSAEMDQKEKAPNLKKYTGLNLVDFYVVPHYKNWEMGKSAKKIIEEYSDKLDLKIINDNQAIYIENRKIRIVNSEWRW